MLLIAIGLTLTQVLLFVLGLFIFLVLLFAFAEDAAIRAQIRERERFFR